jgi:hypothetical protein
MTLRPLLRLVVRASLLALAAGSLGVGCSRQGEGERCDLRANGHDDCDSGLLCFSCLDLNDHDVDRCCPPGGGTGACTLAATASATCLSDAPSGRGGSSGASGGGLVSGAGGEDGAGAPGGP